MTCVEVEAMDMQPASTVGPISYNTMLKCH